MATTDEIDKLFAEDKPAEGVEPATQLGLEGAPAPGSIDELKAKAAAKRSGKAGKNGSTSSVPATTTTDASETPLAATDGVSPNAKDELAKLAAKREGNAGAESQTPSPDSGDGSSDTPLEGDIPNEIPGLTTAEGGSTAYEQRKAEIEEAKARGKKPKGRRLTEAQKAKAAAAKAKEKEKAAAAKAKEKAKADAEKAKAAEAKKKTAKQEAAERRKKMEDERKAKQAEEKARKAAERALKAVPDLISRENKATQAAFAEDYRLAAPKGERNPDGQGVRRAKADRGDFAAGWLMAMRRVRRDLKAQPSTGAAAG